MGDVLFRIADISTVWVLADVAERDLAAIAVGQTATVKPRAYPGRTFTGKITLIYPSLISRRAPRGCASSSPSRKYADAGHVHGCGDRKWKRSSCHRGPGKRSHHSGTRQVVIVDKSDGRFEPREVKTRPQRRGVRRNQRWNC